MSKKGIALTPNDRKMLKLQRIAAGKRQQETADALGRSKRWLCRLEKGDAPCVFTVALKLRLAAFLGIRPEYLLAN